MADSSKIKNSVKPLIEDIKSEVDRALAQNKSIVDADKAMYAEVVKVHRDISVKLEKFLITHETFAAKVKKKSLAFETKLAAAKQHDAKQKKPTSKAVSKVLEGYTKRLTKIEQTLMKELREHFQELEDRKQLSRVFMTQWDTMDKSATDAFNILLDQDLKVCKLFTVDMQPYLTWREKLKSAGAEIPDTEPIPQPRPLDLRKRVRYVPMSQRSDQLAEDEISASNAFGNNRKTKDSDSASDDPALRDELAQVRALLRNPRIKSTLCAVAKGDEELSKLLVNARVADMADIVLAPTLPIVAAAKGGAAALHDDADWESFVPANGKGKEMNGFETADWNDDGDDNLDQFDDSDDSSVEGKAKNNNKNDVSSSSVDSMLAVGRLSSPLVSRTIDFSESSLVSKTAPTDPPKPRAFVDFEDFLGESQPLAIEAPAKELPKVPVEADAKKEDDFSHRSDASNLGRTVAAHGFEGEGEGELTFNEGDIIIYHKDSINEGWCFGETRGQSGWFPISYCDLSG